jgi:hypothetical protein
LQPALRHVADDQPSIYDDGCHLGFSDTALAECVYGDSSAPRIVLFGDSHAAQWFPALLGYAEATGLSIESHTKSSCPAASAEVLRDGAPYRECAKWRESVIEHVNDERPALVVLASYGVAPLANVEDDYTSTWNEAIGRTLDQINVPTVVLADTPDLKSTPSVCLSANLRAANECGRPRAEALDAPARTAESDAAATRGVPYIDLTDYMCSAELCAPVLGNTLVYRDAHHLTATYSAMLAPVLGEQLAAFASVR